MDGPRHGYNIKKLLSERFSACTTINNNTLYSLLKRYEQAGDITKEVELCEGKPNRNIFSITHKGRRQFISILRDIPDMVIKNRDEYMMRLYYFHLLDIPTRKKLLKGREKYLIDSRDCVEAQTHMEATLFVPVKIELQEFHLRLLGSELELIAQMKEKLDGPCPVSDDGNLIL